MHIRHIIKKPFRMNTKIEINRMKIVDNDEFIFLLNRFFFDLLCPTTKKKHNTEGHSVTFSDNVTKLCQVQVKKVKNA